jgi:hypothetical protein
MPNDETTNLVGLDRDMLHQIASLNDTGRWSFEDLANLIEQYL